MSTLALSRSRLSRARSLFIIVLPASAVMLLAAAAQGQDTIATPKPAAVPAAGVPAAPLPGAAPRDTAAAATKPAATDSAALAAARAASGPAGTLPPVVATPAAVVPVAAPATTTATTALANPSTTAPVGAVPASTRDSGAAAATSATPPPAAPKAGEAAGLGTTGGTAAASQAPAPGAAASMATTVDTARARVAPAKSAVAAPTAAPAAAPASAAASAPAPADVAASDLANPFVQRAVSFYEQGKTDAAVAEYRKGIANDPLDSDTWYGLAELLRELGRNKQAIETYTLALATIEHAPELRMPFAELLMANKRKPDAIKVLQRGIELDPDVSADMKAMLGNVVLGVLDDSAAEGAPAASAGGSSAARTPSAVKARAKVDRKKRKKLCKLFCAGAFDPIAPKP